MFHEKIEEIAQKIGKEYLGEREIRSSCSKVRDEEHFESRFKCYVCNKGFTTKKIPFQGQPIHESCLPLEYNEVDEWRYSGMKDDVQAWRDYFNNNECYICREEILIKYCEYLDDEYNGAIHEQCRYKRTKN